MKKYDFTQEFLDKNRNSLLSIMKEKINKNNLHKIEKKKEKLKSSGLNKEICDEAWQSCVYDIQSTYIVREYFIYKTNEIPLIFNDYFDEKIIKFNKIIKNNFDCEEEENEYKKSKYFFIFKKKKKILNKEMEIKKITLILRKKILGM